MRTRNGAPTRDKALRALLDRPFPITLHADPDGGYVAEVRDLPGCISQGETRDEALARIDDARMAWIRSAYAHGDSVPAPSVDASYSGRLLVRMPRSLHRRLAERASQEGVSLNQEVVSLLSERATAPMARGKAGKNAFKPRGPERLAGFIGCAKAPPDLSTAYKSELASSLRRKT